jgi:hypothetical protein
MGSPEFLVKEGECMTNQRLVRVTWIGVCLWCFIVTATYARDGDIDWNVYTNRVKVVEEIRNALASSNTFADWPKGRPTLDEWLANNSEMLRWEICAAIAEYAKTKECNAQKRKEVVWHLVRQLNSESSLVKSGALKFLLGFSTSDFNEDSKKIIDEEFSKKNTKEIIMLAGLADADAAYEGIQRLASRPLVEPESGRYYGGNVWAAMLVTARKGNKTNIERVLKAVDNEKDPVARVTILFKELNYVRQPEVVDYLGKYLDSKERLESVRPGGLGALYAQYAAVSLAHMLRGWPVSKEDLNYTEQELDACRQWMSRQEEWLFR